MTWLLRTGHREYAVLDDLNSPGHESALTLLREFQDDYHGMSALRALVAERYHHFDVSRWSDHRVLEFVARELESGRLRIAERLRPAAGRGTPRTPAKAEAKEEPRPAPVTEVKTDTAWIEIEMVGEDGKPVPYLSYEIKKPDGKSVAKGKLDKMGFAYKGDLESGDYLVSFPDLDKEAWEKV